MLGLKAAAEFELSRSEVNVACPPGPKRTSQLRRAVRRRGHHNPAERLRHCPSSHPEGSPTGGTPNPDNGASRRGTRPPRRAAGARRSLPSPLNLPGDSDASAPRNPAGKSGSQLSLSPERRDPGSSAHRSTRTLRLAPGSWAICGAPGPGLPPRPARPGVVPLPRSRCPRVGSGSGGDLTGPEAMRGADGTRGLGGAGKGRDKGWGGTVRRPEPSARSAGASRSLQQRRPNQSPRSRRGQTSPETPLALLTAEGLAGERRGGPPRTHIAKSVCIRRTGLPVWRRESGSNLERGVVGSGEAAVSP